MINTKSQLRTRKKRVSNKHKESPLQSQLLHIHPSRSHLVSSNHWNLLFHQIFSCLELPSRWFLPKRSEEEPVHRIRAHVQKSLRPIAPPLLRSKAQKRRLNPRQSPSGALPRRKTRGQNRSTRWRRRQR